MSSTSKMAVLKRRKDGWMDGCPLTSKSGLDMDMIMKYLFSMTIVFTGRLV